MSSELFKKFSEELKATRESKDVSLQQISNKTRINIKFLEAIEEGNFGIIDEVYVRAFLREYAQMIDLDGMEALKKYDRCKAGIADEPEISTVPGPEPVVGKAASAGLTEKETVTQDPVDSKPPEKKETEKKEAEKIEEPGKKKTPVKTFEKSTTRTPEPVKEKLIGEDSVFNPFPEIINFINSLKGNTILIASIAAGVLVVFIIIYFAFIKESKPHLITERPYEEIVEEQSQKYSAAPAVEEATTQASVDSLTLMIAASDTSWIRIVIDDSKVEEFILLPSLNKSLRAERDFNLLIGNSGGLELFLNEKSLNFVGRSGGVRNIIVDKDGYRPVTSREPAQNE